MGNTVTRYTPSENWRKLHVEAQRLAARNFSLSGRQRLEAAALGWSDPLGHAEFGPRKLSELLATVNKQTGVVRPAMSRHHLWELIDQLVRDGVLLPGSCAHCLILAPSYSGGGVGTASKMCPYQAMHDTVAERWDTRAARQTVAEQRAEQKRGLRQEQRKAERMRELFEVHRGGKSKKKRDVS